MNYYGVPLPEASTEVSLLEVHDPGVPWSDQDLLATLG